jgi:hypothetical protein
LIVLDFTPRPSQTTVAPTSTPRPSVAAWPLGWDESFCNMFAQAVDAQQLLVDTQLDINDGDNHDAHLLAVELTDSANGATQAIATLPSWPDAQNAVTAIGGLMDLASQAGLAYQSWFTDGKRTSLVRAKGLRTQNGGQVPDANTDLAALAGVGLTCPDTPLVLEAPK